MPKRPSRQNPKQRKGSADFIDDNNGNDHNTKKPRISSMDVTWVKDTTLIIDDDDSTLSSFSQEQEQEEQKSDN